MTKVLFTEMNLAPEIERAIALMGFDAATPIQSEAIPVIRSGADLIARSQTGTGKTLAFAIPAIEKIDTDQDKPAIQVLILCPTRELAMQGCEEIRKLVRFNDEIRPVAIYGGAPIDRQCIALRRANLVIGTPGRVMDHMRRKTIKLNQLKMIVLDEADEMLNMGFREDIETILTDTPESRQTLLFSATMPPAIMKITKQFQKEPVLVEIDRNQVTIESIEQRYVNTPFNTKQDALTKLLQFYQPNCAIVFCATKKMADELTGILNARGIRAACIHSDIRQVQRTATMQDFKSGKIKILIATDIAARGIDVNDVEYVINYDLPLNTEYYVHRIGRTGRAGKHGCSITLCGSKQEIRMIRQFGIAVKSEITELMLPTAADVQRAAAADVVKEMEAHLQEECNPVFGEIIGELVQKGFSFQQIAEAAVSLHYPKTVKTEQATVTPIRQEMTKQSLPKSRQKDFSAKAPTRQGREHGRDYTVMVLDVGSSSRISVNHIVGAITDRAGISARELGKVDVTPEQSFVEVPSERAEAVLETMRGCKICGKPANSSLVTEEIVRKPKAPRPGGNRPYGGTGTRRGVRMGKPMAKRGKFQG